MHTTESKPKIQSDNYGCFGSVATTNKSETSKVDRFSVKETTKHETNLRRHETSHFKTVGCVSILQRNPSELSKVKCNILPEKEVYFMPCRSVHLRPISVGTNVITFWDGDSSHVSEKPSRTFFKENQIADLFYGNTVTKSDYQKACEERINALLTYGINIFADCTTPTCIETALFYIAHGIVIKDNRGGGLLTCLFTI